MSYIDKTYGKQLEEALRGLVSRPALGQPWYGFHVSEVPAGVLLFTATTHSRVLYADFWKYIQDKNLVKTEEEWQSIYSAQGWCPFYSDGDGIDTFRMPSPPLYIKGADNLTVGQYIEAGLPNIVGKFDPPVIPGHADFCEGAFFGTNNRPNDGAHRIGSAEINGGWGFGFDASRSSPIYGKSNTVTPETSKMLFGIWAISAPQQPIPDATVEGIISELGVASNNALEAITTAEAAINGLNGVVRSVNGLGPNVAGNVHLEGIVVERWAYNGSWYRKYSDGWIEQGGYRSEYQSGYITIPFFVPFVYTPLHANYMMAWIGGAYDPNNYRISEFIDCVTTTGMNVFQKGGDNSMFIRPGYWYACGY